MDIDDWRAMNAVPTRACPSTAQVLAQYRDMVYGIALTHTKNRSDADDVFQEVFLVYHRKQPLFEDEERQKAWLITTTLNCVRQLVSSSWRRKVVPLHERDIERGADESFRFRTDEQDAVFVALQELPSIYRSVLHLFYFEDMSIAQISAALDIEVGTVKVRLSRGRAQMRDRLKGEYFDG
ncbi:MAG: sigma-70 family RNA polymerase sigma factor [Coriobacteriales bacterium]|jgi:RNA polymerase sigma-70 factor (ECF subfamily)|nr:sigma-70 family RNA polymerase sigma factor [Coriobacteriales bacterium]